MVSSVELPAEAVIEAGDPAAPAIVLLHGAGMGAWMWQPQLAPLAARYHVLAPDLPGTGAAVDQGPFTLARAAAAVAALIRTRGGGRAHVCGLSVGAMVALQLAQAAPETLASLTLSAGQVHANPLLMIAQRVVMGFVPERAFTESLPAAFERGYPDMVEAARASARRTGKRGVLAVIHAAARADLRRALPRIAVPTLVLCGGDDRLNLPAARQIAAAIPGATLRVIPGAGHVWNLEQPEVFTRTLLEFVQRVDQVDHAGRA